MVSGSIIRDFYINAWRSIAQLVAACNDDPGRIRASTGLAKIAKSLQREVEEMPSGSIFVAYQGFTKGDVRRFEITKHSIAAYIRALTPDDDANIAFGALMIDSIPDGADLPVRYLECDPDCDAMDMPKYERVSASQLTIDIWKLSFTVAENAG